MLEEIRDKKLAIANWIMQQTIVDNRHLSKEQCMQLELAMRTLTSAEETERSLQNLPSVNVRNKEYIEMLIMQLPADNHHRIVYEQLSEKKRIQEARDRLSQGVRQISNMIDQD